MSTGFRSALYANWSCYSCKVSFKLYADTAKLHCFTLPCWLIVSQLHLQRQASAFTFVFSTKIFLTYIPHTHTKKTILEASLSTQPIFLPHFLECLFLSFCWESAININQILFTTSQLTTWVFFLMRCTLMMFAWIYSWVRLTRGNKTGTRAAM